MKLPYNKPMITQFFANRVHPGIDTIPAGTGCWAGISEAKKREQNFKRANTDICSCLPGTLVFADWILNSGNTIIIDSHDLEGNKWRFVYAHLSAMYFVDIDTPIEEGQAIGRMGNSGMQCDEHLHLTVVKNPKYSPVDCYQDNVIDPMEIFGKTFNQSEGVWELTI